jgi:predicted Zn finger-like uncharacterized protein
MSRISHCLNKSQKAPHGTAAKRCSVSMVSAMLLMFQLQSLSLTRSKVHAFVVLMIPANKFTLRRQQQSRMITPPILLSTQSNEVNGVVTPTVAPSSTNDSKQGLYGSELDMPETYVKCGKCQTAYAITEDELGSRGGRRLECSVCGHAWYQTRDRIMTLTPEFELSTLPGRDLERIQNNLQEGKSAKFMGDKKLYVGNLAFQCHEDDLYEIFGQYGDVGDVNMIRDETGRPRGFAFVTMRTDEGGDKAIAAADGMMIRGRNIAVRESNS